MAGRMGAERTRMLEGMRDWESAGGYWTGVVEEDRGRWKSQEVWRPG
jgi:hypothetical protein